MAADQSSPLLQSARSTRRASLLRLINRPRVNALGLSFTQNMLTTYTHHYSIKVVNEDDSLSVIKCSYETHCKYHLPEDTVKYYQQCNPSKSFYLIH